MIVAAMTGSPERLTHLEDAVNTIRPQVDEVRVWLDGDFDEVPEFLSRREVQFAREVEGDLGDGGSLYWAYGEHSLDFTQYLPMDPRFRYPGNYVEAMVAESDARGGRAVVGVGGLVLNPDGSGIAERFSPYQRLARARAAHVLGPATMLLSRGALDFSREELRNPNPLNLQLAIAAQKQKVPMVSVPRTGKWITTVGEAAKGLRHAPWTQLATTALSNWKLYPDPFIAKAHKISDRINSRTLVVERAPMSRFDAQVRALHEKLHGDLFFVVIGAMDGVTYDDLRPHIVEHPEWRGLFVEPLPDMMKRLKENYKGREGLLFEEAAITERAGTRRIDRIPMDKIESGECPPWAGGLGTFYEDHILHTEEELKKHSVTEEIRTITFKALVAKHDLKRIDVLQIDAEGWDIKIFDQVWAAGFRPSIIKIEVNYPNPVKIRELQTRFKLYGYKYFFVDPDDIIAVKI